MTRRRTMTSVSRALWLMLCCPLFAQPEAGESAQRPQDQQRGQNQSPSPNEKAPNLAEAQRRLADRYDRLELLAGRLAELSRSTQPRRARLLREVIATSREQDIAGRFDVIISDLNKESLGTALTAQQELQGDLQRLLELLLREDRNRQIESQRQRIRKYLEEVKRLIRHQRGIKARTEGGASNEDTAEDQDRVAKVAGKLHSTMEANEAFGKSPSDAESEPAGSGNKAQPSPRPSDGGDQESQDSAPQDATPKDAVPRGAKDPPSTPSEGRPPQGLPSGGQSGPGQSGDGQPGGGQPESGQEQQSPMERAAERLKQAQQRMQQAKARLDEAKRENALEKQEEALRELEQAKSELERILRQLREEELERTLVLLEARFRKMLEDQIAVYDETKKLAGSQTHAPRHELEIASGRLRRREESIVRDADRALVLLGEDGTSVAFPEAVKQTRNDMVSVAERLGDVKFDSLTQGLEEDVIESLEEILAALQQALQELREQRAQQQQGKGQQPGDQPLVDQLAELRMIRALQSRINRRTERYGELLGDRQAMEDDVRTALMELGRRQESVFQATRDLESGSNR